MGKRSRTKGNAFESKVAREMRPILGEFGVDTQSQAGKGGKGGADVDMPPFACECKHAKRLKGGITGTLERLSEETYECRLHRIPILWWRFDDGTSRKIPFKERIFIRPEDLEMCYTALYDHISASVDSDIDAVQLFRTYTSSVTIEINGSVKLKTRLPSAHEEFMSLPDEEIVGRHLIVMWNYGKGSDMQWGKRCIFEPWGFKKIVQGLVDTGAINLLKRRVMERDIGRGL